MQIAIVFGGKNSVIYESYIDKLVSFFIKKYNPDYEFNKIYEISSIKTSYDDNTFFVFEESFFDAMSDDFKSNFASRVIILCDKIMNAELTGFECVLKYQDVNNICKCIDEFVMKNISGEIVCENKVGTKVVLFYSPCSVSGNSLISEVFSYLKSQSNKKVLHISLDSFHKIRFCGSSNYSASDYFSDDSEDGKLLRLTKMVCKDGNIDFLKPFDYELDKSCINAKKFAHTINYIINSGFYDYITIDLATSYFDYCYELIDYVYKFVITIGNAGSVIKYERFLTQFNAVFSNKYDEKVVKIFNNTTGFSDVVSCDYALNYDKSLAKVTTVNDGVSVSKFAFNIRRIFDEN